MSFPIFSLHRILNVLVSTTEVREVSFRKTNVCEVKTACSFFFDLSQVSKIKAVSISYGIACLTLMW
jgi:hypothetical protein